MLAYAVRRIILVLPTLLGISLIAFALSALVPDPSEADLPSRGSPGVASDAGVGGDGGALPRIREARRTRFLDLPRFFNDSPSDVATRTNEAIRQIVSSESSVEVNEARRRLVTEGAAALPTLLQAFARLPEASANRVAEAFAPVAVRMGLGEGEAFVARASTPRFWRRFWEDRALDFSAPSIERSIDRLVGYGTALRESDVLVEDTAALPALMEALSVSQNREAVERLSRIANHITRRGRIARAEDDARAAYLAIADWREWWFVHRTDFVRVEGFDRLIATVTDTRYGRSVLRVVTKNFGVNRDTGEPIADEILLRVPVTLFMTIVAMLLSIAIAVPVGAISAWRKGKAVDVVAGGVLFALYSLPTFWVALVLRRAMGAADEPWHGPIAARVILPIVAVATTSIAVLSRAERASMLEVLREDWFRTARAKGVSTFRAVVVHALRNAVLPTISLAGLLFPTLLGSSFVVEAVFQLPGLGLATLQAVARHDHAWVMASVIFAGTASAFGLVASDIAAGLADPRVRDLLIHPHRGLQ